MRRVLIAEFLATPWSRMPERLAAATAVMSRWVQGGAATASAMEQIAAGRLAREARREQPSSSAGNGIAMLPLHGVITQRGNMVDDVRAGQRKHTAVRRCFARCDCRSCSRQQHGPERSFTRLP